MFSIAAATAILSLLTSSLALPQASSSPATHTVQVGANGQLAFVPEAVDANVGDTVIFQFHQKNHSATQSSFANPCGLAAGGFNSGFMPVAADATTFPTFTYTVTGTDPVWVYCAQDDGGHCHAGMVFAVNCPSSGAKSFANFKAAAIAQGNASASTGYGYGSPTTTDGNSSDSGYESSPDTTTYPDMTLPPAPIPTEVTATVTLGASTWTTTYESYPNSPNPTPASVGGNTYTVIVGGNETLTFSPQFMAAQPRDTIVFQFQSKNHTATQSSFDDPCRKLQFTSTTGQVGFDSGFNPVTAGQEDFPTFSVVVNDTAPIWVYCRQTGHCGKGMVFAINPDQTGPRNFNAFEQLAVQINGSEAAVSTPSNSTSPNSAFKVTTSLSLSFVGALVALLL
jgi:plastocyanin